jgi:hypothetical protein
MRVVSAGLHAGLRVELFQDDCEGYQLNATTPTPGWFVLWRMEEEGQQWRMNRLRARSWSA